MSGAVLDLATILDLLGNRLAGYNCQGSAPWSRPCRVQLQV